MSNSAKGRPRGAKNITTHVEQPAVRCINCRGSHLGPAENSRFVSYEGQEFVGIWYRTRTCDDCGQKQIVRTKEFPGEVESTADDSAD